MIEDGINPELLLGNKYGHRLHFWDLAKGVRVHVLSGIRSTMSSGEAFRRPSGASLPLVDPRLVALGFLGLSTGELRGER
jgi:hypothetical protein